jgi:hypothetical protein
MDRGQCPRCRGIDRADLGMAMRRTQHIAIKLIRPVYVVEIAATPHQEPRILETPHRAPNLPFP